MKPYDPCPITKQPCARSQPCQQPEGMGKIYCAEWKLAVQTGKITEEDIFESVRRNAATPEQLLGDFVSWLLAKNDINVARAEQLQGYAKQFLDEIHK